MNRVEIRSWLSLIGPGFTGVRPGWVIARCPLAPARHNGGVDAHPSFGVREDDGDGFTHCFSCGWSGSQSDLILEMYLLRLEAPPEALGAALGAGGDSPLSLSVGREAAAQGASWPGWWLDSFPVAGTSERAVGYLRGRGVGCGEVACEKLDLRYDPYRDRVCFPIRDVGGDLVAMYGRAVEEVGVKYYAYSYQGAREKSAVLGEQWVDFDLPLILVEGPFDVARVLVYYPNAVAVMGASISRRKFRRLGLAQDVVTMFDPDAAGDSARAHTDKFFGSVRRRHIRLPGKDDPGSVPGEFLQEVASYLLSNTL